jgi:DNA-binding response OmpR family regulator
MSNGTLIVDGTPVACGAKELGLLHFFCENPNRVFTATQLYEAIWGLDSLGDDKTVTMHISTLRKKLGDPAKQPKMIVNQRGIGYKFIPPQKEETV